MTEYPKAAGFAIGDRVRVDNHMQPPDEAVIVALWPHVAWVRLARSGRETMRAYRFLTPHPDPKPA